MRCREATGLLSAALDDELTTADAARMSEHVDKCASCQRDRAAFEQLRARLRVSEPFAVDLMPALRDRLGDDREAAFATLEPSPARRVRNQRRGRAFVGIAAAVAVFAAAFVLVTESPSHVSVSTAKPVVAPELRAPTGASLLLAWTSSGLPSDALAHTRALVGVSAVTEVRGDELRLTGERDAAGRAMLALPPGAAIPIDALAIDPVGYALDVPGNAAALVRKLPRDGALLGATSARLRGVGVGGSLTFGATTIRVTGVVADSLVGAAEVIVPDDSPLAVPTPRFLLLAYRGDRSDLEHAIGSALQRAVRFRAPGETPYLRHGDAVLPQALVKARFGEFWYRVGAHGTVTIDPRWVARNIVTIDVPGIGPLRVNRQVAELLGRALIATGAHDAYGASAFAPQLTSAGAGLGLSRHTWGIGLTLTDQRPHTVAVMAAAGFRWGGLWLNRSPDYYEWVGSGSN
jgi:Putative zinc-finger